MGNVSSSQERSRAEIADYLRRFADELDSAGVRSPRETAEAMDRRRPTARTEAGR